MLSPIKSIGPFSDYLRFKNLDALESNSQDILELHGLTYLRLEFKRIRPGMQDYIVNIATPSVGGEEDNTVITLRGVQKITGFDGAKATAKIIAQQLKEKEDKSYDWSKVDIDHMAKMILPAFKYFSTTLNTEQMLYSSEAIK